jgi:hypothetical protein
MIYQRQTHLGSTGTKFLTIVELRGLSLPICHMSLTNHSKSPGAHSHSSLSTSTKKKSISQLPDELLVLIVEFAAIGPDDLPDSCNNEVVLKLSQVCHRLRRLSQPILFLSIRVERPARTVPLNISVLRLLRTLRERADLRQHCR